IVYVSLYFSTFAVVKPFNFAFGCFQQMLSNEFPLLSFFSWVLSLSQLLLSKQSALLPLH
ncbi:hypothetical protein IJ556_02980, partial [bacterium]|nr:hypothetical protein [bacterium]